MEPKELEKREHNKRMRIKAIKTKIDRKHTYRLQVWARNELQIRAHQAELMELEGMEHPVSKPDLNNADTLMQLSTVSVKSIR